MKPRAVCDNAGVVGNAADQVAGTVLVEEEQRLRIDVGEDLAAHIRKHLQG